MAVCSLWERFVKVRFLPTRFHIKANKISNKPALILGNVVRV